ncbi:MAG: hypothetical protein PUB18_02940 [bacterium]|nr:hypothetical protein [bacterium]
MDDIIQKRVDLILDYIAQILVYGSDTLGVITLGQHQFEDGKFMVITVSVTKNRYFRYHDLGIPYKNSKIFYDLLFHSIVEKFQTFSITFIEHSIFIKSDTNGNRIELQLDLSKKIDLNWFQKVSQIES